jgi:hypothetical protein
MNKGSITNIGHIMLYDNMSQDVPIDVNSISS